MYNVKAIISGIFLLASMNLVMSQWNAYSYQQYTTPYSPTFVDLNSYTTQSPYNHQGQNIRIWPYVMGQYYYPYYTQTQTPYSNNNNNNNNNPYGTYDANSNSNLPYNTLYQRQTFKK